MVNPQVPFLELTVEAGIPGDVMRELMGGKNIVCVSRHGGLLVDMVNEGNEEDSKLNTNTPTRVPNTTLQQTSSPDITTVSNTLYNRTSWTTQHALIIRPLTYNYHN